MPNWHRSKKHPLMTCWIINNLTFTIRLPEPTYRRFPPQSLNIMNETDPLPRMPTLTNWLYLPPAVFSGRHVRRPHLTVIRMSAPFSDETFFMPDFSNCHSWSILTTKSWPCSILISEARGISSSDSLRKTGGQGERPQYCIWTFIWLTCLAIPLLIISLILWLITC